MLNVNKLIPGDLIKFKPPRNSNYNGDGYVNLWSEPNHVTDKEKKARLNDDCADLFLVIAVQSDNWVLLFGRGDRFGWTYRRERFSKVSRIR
jgi:hypothetical protein